MDTDQFWSILEPAAQLPDVDDRIRAVISQLEGMPDPELAGFRNHLYESLAALCTPDVYGAGVLITGRTFDEEHFEAFRCVLILKGRDCFEAALRGADTLAEFTFDHQEKELDFEPEMFLFAPHFAYQERHGDDADLDEAIEPTALPDVEMTFEFHDMEQLRAQYPRLWPKRRAMMEPRQGPPEL